MKFRFPPETNENVNGYDELRMSSFCLAVPAPRYRFSPLLQGDPLMSSDIFLLAAIDAYSFEWKCEDKPTSGEL